MDRLFIMKKILLIIMCVWISILSFVGCDPAFNYIKEEETLADTVKVELVDYKNESPKYIRLKKEKPKFDFDKITLIATLDNSLIKDFVKDISQQTLLLYLTAANEPIGKTIILYQANGDMLVWYAGSYTNAKGKTSNYAGCTKFDKNGEFIQYLGHIDTATCMDIFEEKYFL